MRAFAPVPLSEKVLIHISHRSLTVLCCHRTQVVQRRDNYGEDDQQSFNQPWEEYKQGFGNPTKAFWLGNENIFMLTNTEDYQLRIELQDFDGETRCVSASWYGP